MRCNTIREAAEDWAFNHGIPHGKRDEPAWKYSVQDFEAGARWAFEQAIKLCQRNDRNGYLHGCQCAKDLAELNVEARQ